MLVERKRKPSEAPHDVAVLVTPNTSPFELGVVTAVFGAHVRDQAPRHYALAVCTEEPGPVPLADGMTLSTEYGLSHLAGADTVIVCGVDDPGDPVSEALVRALRKADRRGARIVSTCTGAFTLAAAGLLDGRTATTHWLWTDALRERYPRVEVDPTPFYVQDGNIHTSAGSAASLDLCLQLLREDLGVEHANAIARRLVTPPHRDGGQAQYVEAPAAAPTKGADGVARTMRWALTHLTEPVTVRKLAQMAHMSERSYLRHFARATGTSPMRWLISQRIHASLPRLEHTNDPIEKLAASVGFESVVTYRHHFHRVMSTSPSAYRRTFRSTPQPQES